MITFGSTDAALAPFPKGLDKPIDLRQNQEEEDCRPGLAPAAAAAKSVPAAAAVAPPAAEEAEQGRTSQQFQSTLKQTAVEPQAEPQEQGRAHSRLAEEQEYEPQQQEQLPL